MSLIARLLEAGTPGELVEEVAMLLAEKRVLEREQQVLDQRRASDRERKQAQREREKLPIRHVTSRDVTGQDGTAISVEAGLIEGFTPVSPKGDTAPKGAVRNRGSKIPEDWKPPLVAELGPDFRKLAEQWTVDSYRTEAAAFVSYWLGESGAKACKSNWKRAWENRVAQIHGKVLRDQRTSSWGSPVNEATYLDNLHAKLARTPA